MSAYDDLIERITKYKCNQCSGSGLLNNAEPGDIHFRTWRCSSCKGTGFAYGDTYTLRINNTRKTA